MGQVLQLFEPRVVASEEGFYLPPFVFFLRGQLHRPLILLDGIVKSGDLLVEIGMRREIRVEAESDNQCGSSTSQTVSKDWDLFFYPFARVSEVDQMLVVTGSKQSTNGCRVLAGLMS